MVYADFPVREEVAPQRDMLEAYMREHNLSRTQLCVKVFGLNAQGKPAGAGQLYPILNLKVAAGPVTREKFREKLGIELPAVEMPPGIRPQRHKRPVGRPRKQPATPQLPTPTTAREVIEAYRAAGEPRSVPPQIHNGHHAQIHNGHHAQIHNGHHAQIHNGHHAQIHADHRAPLLAFMVGQDGRASLSLNLLEVPSDKALDALQVLLAARLITPTSDTADDDKER